MPQPKPRVGAAARPSRSYETGKVTVWLRRASLALTGIVAVAVLVGYAALPDTIATHYDFSGQPDAWGPKSSVFLLVAIFVVLVTGMTWLSHYPQIFNYPVVSTEDNAQEKYRAGEQMLVWCTAGCSVIFAGIAASTLFEINSSFVIVPGMFGVLAACGVGMTRMIRA